MDLLKKEKLPYCCMLLFLFAAFMEAFGFKNRYMLVCLVLSIGYCLWRQKKIILDVRELILFITFFLYAWIAKKSLLSVTLLPVLFSYLAKLMVYNMEGLKKKEKLIWYMIGVMVLGLCIHGLLNFGELVREYGFAGSKGIRHWGDFWHPERRVPATQQNFYVLPIVAVLFPAVYFIKKHVKVCAVSILMGVVSLWLSLWTDSRIPLLVFAVVLAWELLLFAGMNRERTRIIKWCGILFAGAALFLIFAAVAMQQNWFGIQNTHLYQIIMRDGGILNNIRFKAQFEAIKQLFTYPMGGYQMSLGLSSTHNVWLDMANAAGLIPFIGLLTYTGLSLYDIIRLLGLKNVSQKLKYVLSGIYLAFVLYYMVEPALEANVFLLLPWVYVNGMINASVSTHNEKKRQLEI